MPPSHRDAHPPATDALDLELLAAYLDGRLSPEDRAAVEQRLATDDDAFELFAEAARLHESSEPAGAVVAFPARTGRRRIWTLVAAAAAVLLALGLAATRPWRGPGDVPSAEWVASLPSGEVLASRLGERWTEAPWSELRGDPVVPSAPSPYRPEVAAFRIGARTVELVAALRADDRASALAIAGQLDGLYYNLDQNLVGPAAVAELSRALEDGAAAPEVLGRVRDLDKYHGVEPAVYYEAGRWAAAGRLAALAGDTRFFEGRLWTRGLRRLREHAGSPELREAAGRLASAAHDDLAVLAADIDAVVALLGNGDAVLVD